MNSTDRKAFADQFMLTCLAYEKSFNPELANLYFSDLSEFSVDSVCQAMTCHRKDPDRGRFFPKPADIIHQINAQSRAAVNPEKLSLLWSSVVKAASRGLAPATTDEYLIAALQMIGGQKAVGYADPVELNRLQKEFSANYAAIASASANDLPRHLGNIDKLIAMKTGLVKL